MARTISLAKSISISGALLCTLGLVSCADNNDREDDWQSARHRAYESVRDGKLDAALTEYGRAASIAELFGREDRRFAVSLNDLGRTYALKGSYSQALLKYSEALSILDRLQESTDVRNVGKETLKPTIDALEGLANACEKTAQMEKADAYYRRALNVLLISGEPVRKRQILYEYKSFLRSHGRSEDLANLETATADLRQETRLPNQSAALNEEVNQSMRDGQTALQTNHLEHALECFTRAELDAGKLNSSLLKADAQTQLALVYIALKDTNTAERMFLEALRNYNASNATTKQRHPCMLAYSRFLFAQHRLPEASRYGEMVLHGAEQAHSETDRELIDSLENLASIYALAGQFPKAILAQSKALALTRLHSPSGADTVLQLCYLANIYFISGQEQKANELLKDYVETSRKEHANLLQVVTLGSFAESCAERGDRREAKSFFSAALALSQRVPSAKGERDKLVERLKLLDKASSK